MSIELILDEFKRKSDIDFIVNLAYDSFKEPHGYGIRSDARTLIIDWLYDSTYNLITAYDGKSPVGFCFHQKTPKDEELYSGFITFLPHITYNEQNISIQMVAVNPNKQRKGIASSLINQVIENSKDYTNQFYSTCWKGLEGESYKLFSKLGFQPVFTMGGMYKDESECTIVVKDLHNI